MAELKKRRRWDLVAGVVFLFTMAAISFDRARDAAAHHAVVFMPDRIGGVGDTWMSPGQAYFLSAFCALGAVWLLVRYLYDRTR